MLYHNDNVVIRNNRNIQFMDIFSIEIDCRT